MIDSMPKYQAKISREGHDLQHAFEFTSSTGHLLTLFADLLLPDDTVSGKISMFSRTNPLNVPANVEIDQFIDYFFVPLEMLYSGFGDSLYQVKEPYSSMIKVQQSNNLPVIQFTGGDISDLVEDISYSGGLRVSDDPDGIGVYNHGYVDFTVMDYYGLDSAFLGFYRNFFHNYLNPNSLFFLEYKATYQRNKNEYSVIPADLFQPNVLPLSLLAYNCVYQNFYRLDDREQFDNTVYNIDKDLYDQSPIFVLNYERAFALKYRPYHFDYFTSLKVAPLLNSVNMSNNGAALTGINNYLSSIGLSPLDSDGSSTSFVSGNSKSIGQTSESSPISTAALRSMFAVEKIISVTNRAKKTYDAQVLAHMGVKVPRDVRHELHYLGTHTSRWKIGEVISTAGTSDTPLGDMAGKGYAAFDGKPIHFTAPCHGVFIAIYSSVPRMRYYAPLEKHMQISSRLNFWFEEYEKLGMQPAFMYEALPILASYDSSNMDGNVTRLGWQMRYQEFKQRYDKVSPAFIDTLICSPDGPTAESPTGEFELGSFNTWKNWVLAKRPLSKDKDLSVSLSDFLASPSDLNDIMTYSYGWFLTGTSDDIPDFWKFNFLNDNEKTGFTWNVASLFYRDPFLHFANVDFKKVSKMHANTLPDLNF